MAQTPSTMIALGTPAPDFALPDTEGREVTRDQFRGQKGLLAMFICNHCPFVIHLRSGLIEMGRTYIPRGIAVVAVSSNNVETHPDDSPQKMKEDAERFDYPFPYLYDEDQSVARAYRAACTPDFFLFDENRRLVYRGQFDDARPGNQHPVTGKDLKAAMDALLANQPVAPEQKPSIGCNIKWKPGNEPN